MRVNILMAALPALALALAACETGPLAEAPVVPAATAATGAAVAGPIGAVAGALAAPFVEDFLDETTLAEIGEAERQALGEGRPVTWRAGEVAGTVQPGETFTDAQGRTCRAFVERIQLPDGRTVTPAGTACQTAGGDWEII